MKVLPSRKKLLPEDLLQPSAGMFRPPLIMHELIILTVASAFCLGLSLFRWFYTGTIVFMFLNWNLFLAAIPWVATLWLQQKHRESTHAYRLIPALAIWLLFFPNAPYILTDLFHLRFISSMPVWYDLVLILSYAWTGLLFGFFGLYRIEKMFFPKLGKTWSVILVGGLMFLVSFGIYLGRYLRWNSWDVFLNPLPLLGDLADRFLNPLDHPRTWGVTILMGVFLNLVYWSVKALRIRQHHEY